MISWNIFLNGLHIIGIGNIVFLFKANCFASDIFQWCLYLLKVPDQFQHIIINILAVISINNYRAVFRQMLQRKFNTGFVQKGNFFRK